ncbi:MAG: hypothetical protein HKP30_16125 [Myxococcales bacterium]|nr:hypothetical protein [Myxococcales bacterium]
MPEAPLHRAPDERLSWLLLVAAFSPVLIDLGAHLLERPWAAYCLVFVPLFVSELVRLPRRPARPGLAWTLLVVALAGELLLLGGGFTRASRVFMPLAALGLGLLLGRPDARTSAILIGFVPVPHALVSFFSTDLEATWAGAAARLLHGLGLPSLVEAGRYQTQLAVGAVRMPVIDVDGGLPIAALLFGLVWVAGCQRGWSIAATVLRALPIAALAVPIQIAALCSAALLLRAGWLDDARGFLDVAPFASIVTIALLGPCRPGAHRGGPRRASASDPLSSAAP